MDTLAAPRSSATSAKATELPLVTAAIVAHPDRKPQAWDLARRLSGGSKAKLESPLVPTMVLMDDEGVGCDANHVRAWDALSRQNSPWLMVLEDDALLTDTFHEQLPLALKTAPAPVVSLYLGRERPSFFQHRIAHALVGCSHPGPDDEPDLSVPWVVASRLLHGVGVAIRSDLVREMVPMLHDLIDLKPGIDESVTEYLRMNSTPVAYTVPSLVDHDDSRPSLARHSDLNPRIPGTRVAWATGKREHWTSEFKIM